MKPSIRTVELGHRQPFWWVSLTAWMAGALFAWLEDQNGAVLVLVALAGASGFFLWSRRTVTIDPTGLTCEGRFRTHRIRWDEVERVETDGVTQVLAGASKQLPVAPRYWAPDTREAAVAAMEEELTRRGVSRVSNPRTSNATFRNTRVTTPRDG